MKEKKEYKIAGFTLGATHHIKCDKDGNMIEEYSEDIEGKISNHKKYDLPVTPRKLF